jgi:hypothetical protein
MQGARSFDNCPTTDAFGIRSWFHEERTTCNTIIRIEESMNSLLARAALAVVLTVAAACSDYSSAPSYPNTAPDSSQYTTVATNASNASRASDNGRSAFGLNGTASGFPTGVVFLSGGGSYDVATASNTAGDETTSVRSNGGFRCTDGVAQGPLAGCLTGEGVRWETAQLLASTTFKCSAADATKLAVTGPGRAVLLAEFYRAGDGNEESFRAQMIVSETDLAPNIPGEQTLWVQGVGCGTANVHFNS